MTQKRKIPIDSDKTRAQQERDKELAETGAAPEEVFQESPEAADVVAESEAERVLPQDIRLLAERCEAAEKRAEEEHENLLRAVADFDNYRRRVRAELEQARQFGIEDFIIRLLPVLDNFERAIKTAEEMNDFDALHGGVVLILRQLRDVLEKEGVRPIETEGQQFDPTKHEAVMRVETDEYPDNAIIEEFQKGYMLGDKVIKPSMVKVARHPEE
ncbi:MAG TPA: nucleotide exchange factor GrpE [Armatimonadota bacterium]|nr:nucleotide exchange factor GrpE [Armatimonadota bacterium]